MADTSTAVLLVQLSNPSAFEVTVDYETTAETAQPTDEAMEQEGVMAGEAVRRGRRTAARRCPGSSHRLATWASRGTVDVLSVRLALVIFG